jgi:hypothetical protein
MTVNKKILIKERTISRVKSFLTLTSARRARRIATMMKLWAQIKTMKR